ncbi:MAG: bifunctional diaminohydroxyphosphoribosylaminopyrimidine deaminase/5-amino-6-(5-phosphoribosylamino)uracil reductase RibD [Lachnospiraceae bacterium]|nr:bifunctional diaminohydroxyphosphoribosylaminopyrimidine deaminase/5-amino-6-(5-phosphoribosylamino)uracil reductase RibD [Lachnospiraceae bacterium]
MNKEEYMKMALELALKAEGHTSPNPMVGCVVVRDGNILTTGYHHQCGMYHAEREALTSYDGDVSGADMYVTLEPCCHHGKTPPCTDIIIERGIKRVFVGSMDNNPKVAGNGVRILREHGIEVETGILKDECDKANEVFFHGMDHKRPFVAMKYAMTIDGKIACETGDSQWVSCEKSREHVQNLRKKYRGIMAGIGTVLADNPMLTVRIPGEEGFHTRIICDSNLRIPEDSNIVKTADKFETIIACKESVKDDKNISDKIKKISDSGVKLLFVGEDDNGHIKLSELMDKLYLHGVDGILLEGGGTLNASMLKAGLVRKAYIFIAPKLVGGKDAKSPVEGEGIKLMKDAAVLQDITIDKIENDILITGYFNQ